MSQGLVKFENTAKEELASEARSARDLAALTTDMIIRTQDDLELASEALAQVKGEWKRLEERKKAVTGPLTTALNEVRSWFKPAQDYYAKAEVSLKNSIAGYHQYVADKNAEAMALAGAAAAEKDVEGITEALATIATVDKVKGLSVREVWDYEITDLSQVPRVLLCVNDTAVKSYITESDGEPAPVTGLRFFKRAIVASRSK